MPERTGNPYHRGVQIRAGLLLSIVVLAACTTTGDSPDGLAAGGGSPARASTAPTAPGAASPSGATAPPTSAPPPSASPAPTPSAIQGATTDRDPALDLPLIRAAAAGELERVERLLARGASVRATDAQGRTPLVAAAYGNHVEAAEVLLAAGADPNEKDNSVQSAYLISTSEVGDDPALLDLLLAAGADVDSRDSFNGTGLIRAADRGYPRVVERLLQTDIAVDHVNRLGWTALHEAIILGNGTSDYVEVVSLLVDAGADVDLPSAQDGISPLAHARRLGHDRIAAVLVDAGATP